ncbi:MAG: hypothetical protein O3B13_15060 [Planctomycetota bacterium]|nr:hypothetical protein [Planctomycetota bacterium]
MRKIRLSRPASHTGRNPGDAAICFTSAVPFMARWRSVAEEKLNHGMLSWLDQLGSIRIDENLP